MPEQDLAYWTELSRTISESDRLRYDPPPGLFDTILAGIREDEPVSGELADSTTEIVPEVGDETPVIDLTTERNRRAPSAERQRRRSMFVVSLAAACALVVGFALFTGGEADETFVAQATNSGLPEAFDGSATATLVNGDEAILEINFSNEIPTDEPVELWLIKPDLSDMVSLGIVEPGDTTWTWPEGIPPEEYSLVDLSIEPNDGIPEHSGRSILRGELQPF